VEKKENQFVSLVIPDEFGRLHECKWWVGLTHHKKIDREPILFQFVVCHIQNFQGWGGSEPTSQGDQPVHAAETKQGNGGSIESTLEQAIINKPTN